MEIQKDIHNNKLRKRLLIISIFFYLFFSIILIKACHVQIYKGKWLSSEASKQYLKNYKFPGKRGTIYDRKKNEMAVTIDSYSVFSHPNNVTNIQKTAKSISKILHLDKQEIINKLESDKKFVWIKRIIMPSQARLIKSLNIKGIYVTLEPGRVYPSRSLCSQVIGFTGIDSNGLEGIEYYYNDRLMGREVYNTLKKDAFGRSFSLPNKIAHEIHGSHIVLTIDQNIQYLTEKVLKETVIKNSAKSAIAIVMVPYTGEILAIAHYPTFNPNNYLDYDRFLWRNRAITDSFEPGSTMKIFVAASALESGKCDSNSLFYCENGSYQIGKKVFTDSKPHSWLSLKQIIKYSSNIGAIKLGEFIGSNYLYNMLTKFGFGSKTGIDCPGEIAGSLIPVQNWSIVDKGAISFGYGISVSSIQLISAACVIANNGVYMKPYLVKSILDYKGDKLFDIYPQKLRQVISVYTAKAMREIMKAVVEKGGTGELANLSDYSVCGKTGTANKLDSDGTYSTTKHFASFLGFAPADKPEIVILVVVDEPQKEVYGGKVAAPAFKKIAYGTLNYLNILSDKQ